MPEESEKTKLLQHVLALLEYEETKEDCLDCVAQLLSEQDVILPPDSYDREVNIVDLEPTPTMVNELSIPGGDVIEGIRLITRSGISPRRDFAEISVIPGDTLTITWRLNFNDNIHRIGPEDRSEEDVHY
jgi:hypothetical protein